MDVRLCLLFGLVNLVLGILGAIYIFLKHCNNYWAYRCVVHEKPELFYGNVRRIGRSKSYRQTFRELYEKYKNVSPFVGFYMFFRHTAIILDLDLIKNVLIKDFTYFSERGGYYNEKHDPLSANLLNLEETKWRKLRAKLTPTFSTGKIKFMFPTLIEVAERLAEALMQIIDQNSKTLQNEFSIEIKELLACYSTDVIGTCAFGIECNSLKDTKTKFRIMGKRALTVQRHGRLLYAFMQIFPNLARKFGMKSIPDDISTFFMNVVRETVAIRESDGIKRNDFMNLLIELKNNPKDNNDEFTIEEMAAQAYVFFLAGFETSSSTMSFCLYELAINSNVQTRVRKEIHEMLKRYDDKLTYEGIKELKYLQQIIQESMRLYTLLNSLSRVAVADYNVPNSTHVIEKGTLVLIPIDAIHHDADIYSNPDVFDPERFASGEIEKRHPVSLLVFGEGPRNCIGLRFGEMQMLVGLVVLLSRFKFSASKSTQIPLIFNTRSWILSPKDGIHLKVEKLDYKK